MGLKWLREKVIEDQLPLREKFPGGNVARYLGAVFVRRWQGLAARGKYFFGKGDRAERFETDLGAVDPGMFEKYSMRQILRAVLQNLSNSKLPLPPLPQISFAWTGTLPCSWTWGACGRGLRFGSYEG